MDESVSSPAQELLRTGLRVVRDPRVTAPSRLAVYRHLFRALELYLRDRDVARVVHREWLERSAIAASGRHRQHDAGERSGAGAVRPDRYLPAAAP